MSGGQTVPSDGAGDREPGGEPRGDSGPRPSLPVRRADPRMALLAIAMLCAACVAIGFALGRTL